ncbi:hypothetical protein HY416_01505 [Candidatus Kaiserbacteria bacterium]|nr:hypothetical protein [Candidatus Kaiserbacteria bacterium]
MAVLWEQRKLVRELEDFENKELKRLHQQKHERIPLFFVGDTKFWVLENKLLRAMMQKYQKEETDVAYIRNWKNLLRTCIANKFVIDQPNPHFREPENLTDALDDDKSSLRLIRVGADKGTELLNKRYFWCKYIPETLKPVEQIGVQIIISLLTAVVTTLLALATLTSGEPDGKENVVIYVNDPQAEVSTTTE